MLAADVIVHVRDAAHDESSAQKADVLKVLQELGVSRDRPMLEVLNKIDLLEPEQRDGLLLGQAEVKATDDPPQQPVRHRDDRALQPIQPVANANCRRLMALSVRRPEVPIVACRSIARTGPAGIDVDICQPIPAAE